MKILKSELKSIIRRVINEQKENNLNSKTVDLYVQYKNICIVDSEFIKSNGGKWLNIAGYNCKRIKVEPGKYKVTYKVSHNNGTKVIAIPSGEMWVGDPTWYFDNNTKWISFLKKTDKLRKFNQMGQIYIGNANGHFQMEISWEPINK